MKLAVRVVLRTTVFGGLATGLSFVFPPLTPLFFGAAGTVVVGSTALTINKIKKEEYLDSVQIGDLEYYDEQQIQPNVIEITENVIANKLDKLKERNVTVENEQNENLEMHNSTKSNQLQFTADQGREM